MGVCGGLEGGREAVQGAVVGQGEGERGGRGVVREVRRGGLSLRRGAASATAVGATAGGERRKGKRGKQFIFLKSPLSLPKAIQHVLLLPL